jgi:hypothetical protein
MLQTVDHIHTLKKQPCYWRVEMVEFDGCVISEDACPNLQLLPKIAKSI